MKLLNTMSSLVNKHFKFVLAFSLIIIAIIYYFLINKYEGMGHLLKHQKIPKQEFEDFLKSSMSQEELQSKTFKSAFLLMGVMMELSKNPNVKTLGDVLKDEYKIILEPVLKKFKLSPQDLMEAIQLLMSAKTNRAFTPDEHAKLHMDIAKQAFRRNLLHSAIFVAIRKIGKTSIKKVIESGIILKENKSYGKNDHNRYVFNLKHRFFKDEMTRLANEPARKKKLLAINKRARNQGYALDGYQGKLDRRIVKEAINNYLTYIESQKANKR